jgi:RimJ/RimL family protein N-acetyltransferase
LFDYSLETFLDIPLRCTLGYAIGVSFRQKYYATEALKHLIAYAFEHHGKSYFWFTLPTENKASNQLMKSLGFRLANEDYHYDGGYNYYIYEIK